MGMMIMVDSSGDSESPAADGALALAINYQQSQLNH
jgi:hypothetical protein